MSLIDNFKTDDILVIRQITNGTFVAGRFVAGDTEEIAMVASVQPDTGKTENIGDQSKVSDKIKIFTDLELLNADSSNEKGADIVVWRGEKYQVNKVNNWTMTDISHYETIAIKQDESDDN